MKTCTGCGRKLAATQFNLKHGRRIARCKTCTRLASKHHYVRNHRYYYMRNSKRKKIAATYIHSVRMSSVCKVCGESHPACLDFHHRNADTKNESIGLAKNRGWPLWRIRQEIAKCDVLCSNCHRKLHDKERKT